MAYTDEKPPNEAELLRSLDRSTSMLARYSALGSAAGSVATISLIVALIGSEMSFAGALPVLKKFVFCILFYGSMLLLDEFAGNVLRHWDPVFALPKGRLRTSLAVGLAGYVCIRTLYRITTIGLFVLGLLMGYRSLVKLDSQIAQSAMVPSVSVEIEANDVSGSHAAP